MKKLTLMNLTCFINLSCFCVILSKIFFKINSWQDKIFNSSDEFMFYSRFIVNLRIYCLFLLRNLSIFCHNKKTNWSKQLYIINSLLDVWYSISLHTFLVLCVLSHTQELFFFRHQRSRDDETQVNLYFVIYAKH